MSVSSVAPNATEEAAARTALVKVLASTAFSNVERLRRFLRFIVEQTLTGGGDKLKEFLIGVDVFEKPDSFDPRNDPIVRVQARRLRGKLAQYYETEGREDIVWIDLPKGSYVPTFQRQEKLKRRALPGALPSQNTIAVLPFADRSPLGDQEYFAGGLRDEIIHILTKNAALRTIPWTRPLQHEDRLTAVLGAAEELDIATIIDGSIRKSGENLRITVQLIDAVRGVYAWSENFDSHTGDIFSVQEEIAQAIMGELKGHLSGDGQARLTRRATENLDAYNLYLRGRYHINQRSETSLRRAADCFEKAILEDSRFALAHSGLADALSLLANYGYVSPGETWRRAAAAATSGVLLDPSFAETHTSLAHVNATHGWEWASAEAEFRKAIQLNPRYAAARHWFGITCLAPQGRLVEAIEEMEFGLKLDPASPIISRDLAVLYYFKRDFEAAHEQAQQTIDQEPHFYGAYWIMGLVLEQKPDFEQAIACFHRAMELVPDNPRMLSALGRSLALAGKKEEARKVLQKLDELALKRYVSPLHSALIQFGLEDHEQAFERINRLLEYRCYDLIHLRVDPRFDPVRGIPRFASLVTKLGLASTEVAAY